MEILDCGHSDSRCRHDLVQCHRRTYDSCNPVYIDLIVLESGSDSGVIDLQFPLAYDMLLVCVVTKQIQRREFKPFKFLTVIYTREFLHNLY